MQWAEFAQAISTQRATVQRAEGMGITRLASLLPERRVTSSHCVDGQGQRVRARTAVPLSSRDA